jgi:hypothetical protein
MNEIYIVLYPDATIIPTTVKPRKSDHQKGTRLFEVNFEIPLYRLSEWFGNGFVSKHFVEITKW